MLIPILLALFYTGTTAYASDKFRLFQQLRTDAAGTIIALNTGKELYARSLAQEKSPLLVFPLAPDNVLIPEDGRSLILLTFNPKSTRCSVTPAASTTIEVWDMRLKKYTVKRCVTESGSEQTPWATASWITYDHHNMPYLIRLRGQDPVVIEALSIITGAIRTVRTIPCSGPIKHTHSPNGNRLFIKGPCPADVHAITIFPYRYALIPHAAHHQGNDPTR